MELVNAWAHKADSKMTIHACDASWDDQECMCKLVYSAAKFVLACVSALHLLCAHVQKSICYSWTASRAGEAKTVARDREASILMSDDKGAHHG